LSKIEFEALRKRFKEAKHKNTDLEVSKAAIRAQLEKLIRLNRMRMDFQEQFLHQASCASPPAKIGCYLHLQIRSGGARSSRDLSGICQEKLLICIFPRKGWCA